MLLRNKIYAAAIILLLGTTMTANAEFTLVSGFQTQNPAVDAVGPAGASGNVARSLAHGFPLWYQDSATTLKIEPCLDFGPIIDEPANVTDQGELLTLRAVNAFCFSESTFLNPAEPVSFNGGAFPENFPELFPYYALGAEAAGDFNANGLEDGLILVETGLSGGFVNETPVDGDQIMIAETFVRLRGLPPADGYTLETAYATFSFSVLGPDVRFSQSVNTLVGGDFLGVMAVAGTATAIRDVANLTTSNTPGPPLVFDDLDEFFIWRPTEIAQYNTAFQAAFPLAGASGGVPPTPGVDAALNRIFSPVLNAAGQPSGIEQLYLAVGQAESAIEPAPPGFQAPAEQPVFNVGAAQQDIVLTAPVAIEPDLVNNATGADGADGLGDIDGDANLNQIILQGFSLQGKIFNDGPNTPPATLADNGFASAGASSLIVMPGGDTLDVTANDTDDLAAGTNVHAIHPGSALALAWDETRLGTPVVSYAELPSDDLGTLLLAASVATEKGGTVRRAINRITGKMQFLYTPPVLGVGVQTFVGQDRFMYVVQDKGGLISSITPVDITVEAVNMTARYRAKTGRWTIFGNSSETTGNNIEIFNGPSIEPGAAPIATAVVADDGTWRFEGKLPVSPDGTISCRSVNGVALLNQTIEIQ